MKAPEKRAKMDKEVVEDENMQETSDIDEEEDADQLTDSQNDGNPKCFARNEIDCFLYY